MTILKSELKQLITHEIGLRVDDALESAKKDVSSLEGKQAAFLESAKAVEALTASVDKDVGEEKYGIETAEVVKRYIMRGFHALQNLSAQASQLRIAQSGKVQGFEHTVKLLSNIIEQEKAKLAALKAAELGPPLEPRDRPAGVRPVSIKEQRLAEAAEVAAAAMPEQPVEIQPEQTPVKEEEAARDTPKKQRGRKRASDA